MENSENAVDPHDFITIVLVFIGVSSDKITSWGLGLFCQEKMLKAVAFTNGTDHVYDRRVEKLMEMLW